jgi:hypothetical protein
LQPARSRFPAPRTKPWCKSYRAVARRYRPASGRDRRPAVTAFVTAVGPPRAEFQLRRAPPITTLADFW